MPSDTLSSVVILLCAAVVIVALFRALRLSPVLGYLAAGAAIGPYGLKLIVDMEATHGFAEFGVIFLLFLIGLELSVERLRAMRTHVFGFGSAQFLLTASIFALAFLGLGGDAASSLIIGGGLALSSTAIVLQVVSEQGEKSSQIGRLSLATLILQDLAVIPLLVFTAIAAAPGNSLITNLTDAFFRGAVGITVIFLVGYYLLRPFFRFIARLKSTELFTATTMFVVLGTSYLSYRAGLSPALGAFMAGLLIAETEFKLQVEADILPFKELFLGLFFMTVGMSLDVHMLTDRFMSIIGLTCALMASKALVIIALCRLFGFPLTTAVRTGLLLSQGSEFAFVLFALAATNHLLPAQLDQILMVVVTMSMALTPLAADFGRKLGALLERKTLGQPEDILASTLDLSQHVIVCGYGRVGHTVCRLLENEIIPYIAIDTDSLMVMRERKMGIPVYFGDATRLHVLSAIGIKRARAVIITHNDVRSAVQTIHAVRDGNMEVPIIARGKNIEQVQKLERSGANLAIAEMFEVSLQLGGALLRALGVADQEITRLTELFREADYALTRTAERS